MRLNSLLCFLMLFGLTTSLLSCTKSPKEEAVVIAKPTWPTADLSAILSSSGKTFYFYNRELGVPPYLGSALENASATYSLGIPHILGVGAIQPQMIGEWDWSAMQILANASDGAGLPRGSYPCFNHNQGCSDPTSEMDAYSRMKTYYQARVAALPAGSPIIAFTGHSFMGHYQGEWGADLLVNEVGENVISTQAHVAFTRGAGRQYLKPWGINMASWFGNSIRDSSGMQIWTGNCAGGYPTCTSSTSTSGHSLNLTRWTYFSSYMAGANFLMEDHGSVGYFSGTSVPLVLSPLGTIAQDLNLFAAAHPVRGTPFVPFAIVMDRYHGMGIETWTGAPTTWDTFSLDSSRLFTKSLFESIWPNGFLVSHTNESGYMVPTPFGDTFDVLLETAPEGLFKMYSVLIASGHLANDPDQLTHFKNYVTAGGTLVLDSTSYAQTFLTAMAGATAESAYANLPLSSAAQFQIGSGKIILVKSSSSWPAVLSALSAKVLPFQITVTSADGSKAGQALNVQYQLNQISEDHWVVTLINTNGVTKQPSTMEVIDGTWALNVEITATSGQIQNVSSWKGSAPTSTSPLLRVNLPAGDLGIYEFTVAR